MVGREDESRTVESVMVESMAVEMCEVVISVDVKSCVVMKNERKNRRNFEEEHVLQILRQEMRRISSSIDGENGRSHAGRNRKFRRVKWSREEAEEEKITYKYLFVLVL